MPLSESRLPGIAPPAVLHVPGVFWMGELVYDDAPPSLNMVGSRGASEDAHWAFTAKKQEWQGALEQLLMLARVPRGVAVQAFAGATMRFPRPNTRRDSGNFSGLLEKALGDALVNYRAIPDDTAGQFCFTGVEFEGEGGPKRTTITLWLRKVGDA